MIVMHNIYALECMSAILWPTESIFFTKQTDDELKYIFHDSKKLIFRRFTPIIFSFFLYPTNFIPSSSTIVQNRYPCCMLMIKLSTIFQDGHVHVQCDPNYISQLLVLAEPELSGW